MKTKLLLFFISLILALLPIGIVIASDITDAKYMTKITIENTGNTTLTNQVAVFTLSTAEMISKDMLGADATDYTIKTGGTGTDIKSTAGWDTNPWCTFVDSLDAGSTTFQYLYSKDVTGGDIVWIPGSTGGTIPDTMAEPGNDFSMNFTNMCLNTNNGTSKDIWTHYDGINGGCRLSVDETDNETINFIVFDPSGVPDVYPTIEAQNSDTFSGGSVDVTYAGTPEEGDLILVFMTAFNAGSAQSATPPAGFTELFKTPYNPVAGVYLMFASWYKAATAGETSGTWAINPISTGASYQTFLIDKDNYSGVPVAGATATASSTNPDPPSLTSGFGAVKTTWLAACNQYENLVSAAPVGYSDFTKSASAGFGSVLATAQLNQTAATENPGVFTSASTYWEANTVAIRGSSYDEISLSNVAIDEYDYVAVSLSGGTLSLNIYGTSNTTAYAGSIPDSSASHTFCDDDAVLFVESIEYWQGGAKVDLFDYEYAATFTGDTTGNVLTPSFRTTSSDADLTATVTSSEGTYEGSIPIAGSDESWEMVTSVPSEPSGLFTDGGTGFPLGAEIATAATAAGDNPDNWIILFAFGLALFIFILLYAATHKMKLGQRGSLILAFLGSEAMLVYFYIVGAIPGLSLIPVAIIILGLVLLRKSAAPVD